MLVLPSLCLCGYGYCHPFVLFLLAIIRLYSFHLESWCCFIRKLDITPLACILLLISSHVVLFSIILPFLSHEIDLFIWLLTHVVIALRQNIFMLLLAFIDVEDEWSIINDHGVISLSLMGVAFILFLKYFFIIWVSTKLCYSPLSCTLSMDAHTERSVARNKHFQFIVVIKFKNDTLFSDLIR